ncbi:MAG: fimbria major subunit, partial [Muribaculaceae bacterium]|nr:fimbria major subunit [Muribaculaceae bacterium]
ANGTTLQTSDQILHGSTSNPTWGIQTEEGANKINNLGCFIMSNAEDCTGTFDDPGTNDGTEAKPWLIKTNIKLARLATRFEYSADNKTSYTALSESGIKMAIAGFDVETYATSTYRVAMFSENGAKPEGALTLENHGHYAPSDDFPYRVTDSYGAPDEFGTYTDYNYVLTPDNKYTYKRPNTVSKNYTFKNDKFDFEKVPFAVIKAQFECTDFAGTGAPSASMAAGDKVFAINGIFLGGLKDYKALKAAGKEFKVNYDNSDNRFSDSDIAKINLVEQNYKRILAMSLPSSYDNTKTDADDENWLQKAFDGADVYTPIDGKYYTYYGSLILHEANNADPYWKYGVSRNLSYVLMVKSFKWLGNNGTGHPGEGPEASELSEMAIQLSVQPVKWTANFANKWDL